MRRSMVWVSMMAVLLWAGGNVLAQGQGKGKGGKDQVKNAGPQADNAQQNAPAAGPQGEKGSGKKAEKASDSEAKGKGKGQEQQGQSLQKQLQHAQAKHLERQARLTRLRELAVKKGDQEMIARVDKLIAKEQEVHGRKQARLQGQPRALPAGAEKTKTLPAGPEDAGKGKGRAAAEKAAKAVEETVKEQKKVEPAPAAPKK